MEDDLGRIAAPQRLEMAVQRRSQPAELGRTSGLLVPPHAEDALSLSRLAHHVLARVARPGFDDEAHFLVEPREIAAEGAGRRRGLSEANLVALRGRVRRIPATAAQNQDRQTDRRA